MNLAEMTRLAQLTAYETERVRLESEKEFLVQEIGRITSEARTVRDVAYLRAMDQRSADLSVKLVDLNNRLDDLAIEQRDFEQTVEQAARQRPPLEGIDPLA